MRRTTMVWGEDLRALRHAVYHGVEQLILAYGTCANIAGHVEAYNNWHPHADVADRHVQDQNEDDSTAREHASSQPLVQAPQHEDRPATPHHHQGEASVDAEYVPICMVRGQGYRMDTCIIISPALYEVLKPRRDIFESCLSLNHFSPLLHSLGCTALLNSTLKGFAILTHACCLRAEAPPARKDFETGRAPPARLNPPRL